MRSNANDGARVTRLSMTAIKGFALQEVPELTVTEDGVVGDRAFFLIDGTGKLLSATRTARFLPYWSRFDPAAAHLTIGTGEDVVCAEFVEAREPVRAHFFGDRYATGNVVAGPWNRVLSELAGRPVRLVRASDPLGGYDVHHMSLISEASVRALGGEDDGSPLSPRRFRMTVTIDGVPAFTEDSWVGRLVEVGEALVEVHGVVRRCAAVQKRPDGVIGGVDPLQRIKEVRGAAVTGGRRGLNLGVYAEVARSAPVRVGDPVRIQS